MADRPSSPAEYEAYAFPGIVEIRTNREYIHARKIHIRHDNGVQNQIRFDAGPNSYYRVCFPVRMENPLTSPLPMLAKIETALPQLPCNDVGIRMDNT